MALFNVFGRASGFIRYLLLVGFLSDPHYALITFAFSFGRLGRTFMDGGLDILISRDGARDRNKVPSFYLNALIIKAALGLIFFVSVYFYLACYRGLTLMQLFVVYASLCGSAMLSFTGIVRSCFTAIERMEYIFYTTLPTRLIAILLLFIALWFAFPLLVVAAAVSMEYLLWFLLLGGVSLRFFSPAQAVPSSSTIRYMILESWPLALYGFFTVVYLSLDVLMIEVLMGGHEAVAPYTYASLLMEGVTMLLTGYIIAIYPVLSRLHDTDEKAYLRLFNQSVIVILGCTLPLSILLAFWADGWMSLIKDTGPITGRVLQILTVNLNLSMMNTLVVIVFTSRNRQRLLVVFTAIAVSVSFLSNLLLIPIYQQPGAAFASLISQLVLFVIMAFMAYWIFSITFPWRKPLSIFAVSLLAGIITRFIPAIPILLVPFVYVAFLALFVHLFGVFTPREIQKLFKALKS